MTPDEMASLHAQCFTLPAPWPATSLASTLADPASFVLLESESFLIGRAVAGEAEVLTLAVAPQARRRGMASKLMVRFLYQARLRGAEDAFLEVAEGNAAAIALYTRFGFAPAGRRRGYYHGPKGMTADAIVMRRVLTNPADRAPT